MIHIYTDGACRGNPGPGGWGVYCENDHRELRGSSVKTTNNRMELQAVIRAFDLIEKATAEDGENKYKYTIYTDSQYVYKGIVTWRQMWKANNWRNSKKKVVENIDLWKELDVLVDSHPNTTYQWVKGHNGTHGNVQADRLATSTI